MRAARLGLVLWLALSAPFQPFLCPCSASQLTSLFGDVVSVAPVPEASGCRCHHVASKDRVPGNNHPAPTHDCPCKLRGPFAALATERTADGLSHLIEHVFAGALPVVPPVTPEFGRLTVSVVGPLAFTTRLHMLCVLRC